MFASIKTAANGGLKFQLIQGNIFSGNYENEEEAAVDVDLTDVPPPPMFDISE